ncbi:MAG TPA: group II intron reverse transcriptase/maturase [Acidimicrobiales bacterium]|nr:group II intron reverse transcriptase/maturase [Acidimicrobiales bacterium]
MLTKARSVRRTEGVDKTRALQRVLYRSAKQEPTRRFHALYGQVARSDVLALAWEKVRANRGAAGVDGVNIADVEASGVGVFLQEIATALRNRTYRPAPLRRVFIPKAGETARNASRPLSIPTVRDRVVMTAAKIVLEPIFEADFLPASFGFRPKRSAHMACEAIRVEVNRGADWVLDADLSNCFGSIRHDALMTLIERRVSDRDVLKLLRSWLRVGVLRDGVVSDDDPGLGTPQGSPISPLLANVALHELDQAWAKTGWRYGVLVRYADDYVVVCRSQQQAEEAQRRAEQVLAPLGLQLNPNKTRIACLTRGAEGFDFLGFHHHTVESWKWRGHWYLQRWPSKRAMKSVRAKVRDLTQPRFGGVPWEAIVGNLNRVLRGWTAYFRYGNSSRKFEDVERYVHERLAILASRKHGKPGWNLGRFNWEWLGNLGVYRLRGKTRWGTAHAWR